MVLTKRKYGLGIWALTFGYFAAYIPYSGLSKAVTSGLLNQGPPVPVAEVLPSAALSTAAVVLLFITLMRWWRYGRKGSVYGLKFPFPRQQTIISGIGFATIILTTTLAYSFSGVSIILALVLMRAGVLVMSPIIDRVFGRQVRWFSWGGLLISLAALAVSFSSIRSYTLSLSALLNLAAYLTGHAMRIPSMTRIAKTGPRDIAFNYFVEEQTVAMTVLVLVPVTLGLVGRGEIAHQFRYGLTHLFTPSIASVGWAIGFFYAALGIFLSFIYLDRRENTFCMSLFACSSLLSGIVASYLLMWWMNAPAPNAAQLTAALLIIAALLIMSPLHHLPMYAKQLRDAIAEKRLRLVTLVHENPRSVPGADAPLAASIVTIDLNSVRNILDGHKRNRG